MIRPEYCLPLLPLVVVGYQGGSQPHCIPASYISDPSNVITHTHQNPHPSLLDIFTNISNSASACANPQWNMYRKYPQNLINRKMLLSCWRPFQVVCNYILRWLHRLSVQVFKRQPSINFAAHFLVSFYIKIISCTCNSFNYLYDLKVCLWCHIKKCSLWLSFCSPKITFCPSVATMIDFDQVFVSN